jgi:hypothetical protein
VAAEPRLPDFNLAALQTQGHWQFILRIIQRQYMRRVADNASDRLNARRV